MTETTKTGTSGGLPPATPVDLPELVAYQEESIVSRTLARQNGGALTLFAFDAGQSLSEHAAPFDAVVQVLEGRADLIIGGDKVAASRGQAVLMPAHVPHAVHAPERFKMLLVMIREVAA
jgi:quercetin dioxygenase-like cupin family protein